VSPYRHGTADPRAARLAEEFAAAAFETLNAVKKAEHMAFLKCKLGEWYLADPNGISPAAAWRGDEEDASQATPPEHCDSQRSLILA
jgi:hypothetical protein